MENSAYRTGVFISFSHEDKPWLDKLQTALKPLARGEKITVWDDTQILPGAVREEEIAAAIGRARIAILLVSPHFLASDRIYKEQLPQILEGYRKGDLIVYWLAISASVYEMTDIAKIQALNDPDRPLDSLSPSEQNKTLTAVAKRLAKGMDVNVISNALSIIDEFLPRQRAFIDHVEYDDNARPDYAIQARQDRENIALVNRDRNIVEIITADEIEALDPNAKQLIRTYERTMKDLFNRWTELQPLSYARDETIKAEAREEMAKIRTDLCWQLNSILNFLQTLGKSLDDHYYYARYICAQ